MVGSYDVKHVDISESEGYCGSDNNIDLQNLLAYHHCLSKFRQDEAKIGQSPALCNNWTPTWSMWMPHSWSLDPGSRIHCFSWVINQSMYFPRRRGPGIYDIDPLTLGTTPRCFLVSRHPKGAAVKSKGRAKESECVQMAILVGKIMENRKMMIEPADGMG
jgi:hypothetical protein